MKGRLTQEQADTMNGLSDEQRAVVEGLMADLMNVAQAQVMRDVTRMLIGFAADNYFVHHPATDSEAAHLIDLIYASLGEAEEREAQA